VIEIAECVNEAEKQLSLGVYNAVWPQEAVTMDEVRSFKAQTLDYGDFIGPGGSVAVAVMPQRPTTGFVLLTAHTPGFWPDRLAEELAVSLGAPDAGIERGPLTLTARSGATLDLGAFARWPGKRS